MLDLNGYSQTLENWPGRFHGGDESGDIRVVMGGVIF